MRTLMLTDGFGSSKSAANPPDPCAGVSRSAMAKTCRSFPRPAQPKHPTTSSRVT